MIGYSQTQELLDKLETVRKKYCPESDSFQKDSMESYLTQLKMDEFDRQRSIQQTHKFQYYSERISQSFVDLMSAAQFRLSLFNIFNLTDNVDLVKMKNRKVKNQVKILRERLESATQYSQDGIDHLQTRII